MVFGVVQVIDIGVRPFYFDRGDLIGGQNALFPEFFTNAIRKGFVLVSGYGRQSVPAKLIHIRFVVRIFFDSPRTEPSLYGFDQPASHDAI